MKKIVSLILVCIYFLFLGITASAQNEEVQDSIYSDMFSSLNDETMQTLERFGFDHFDYGKMTELSPKDFVSYFLKILQGKIEGPVKMFLIILSIIMIVSAAFSFFPDNENRKQMLATCSCVIVALITARSVFPLIKGAMSVIDMTSKFIFTLLPILAGLIASCRNPVMAVSMNSVSIYIANIISLFANKYLTPFMSIFFAVSCVGCISNQLDLKELSSFIKNTVIKILSVTASFYISFLSIKGLFSNSVDTVTSKGVKLIISSAIPVIGSSLSEAYFALSGSLTLLKNTVGIIGIIIIVVINAPMIIELFIWTFLLSLAVIFCKTLSVNTISSFLDSVVCVLKTLNIILIFCVSLLIISIGLMITIRSGS